MKLTSRANTLASFTAPFHLFEVVRNGFGILDVDNKFLHMADEDPIMAAIQVESLNLFWEQNKIAPIYTPDWSKAPHDAKFHSIDEDGQCTWWVNKPSLEVCCWWSSGGYFYPDAMITPNKLWQTGLWTNTLIEKPI
jgi:hypothetical protein